MIRGKRVEPGPAPPDLLPDQWSFLGPVVLDTVPHGRGKVTDKKCLASDLGHFPICRMTNEQALHGQTLAQRLQIWHVGLSLAYSR